MNEVKDSIEVEISSVKENMGKNEMLLTEGQNSQVQLDEKLDTLNGLQNDVTRNAAMICKAHQPKM